MSNEPLEKKVTYNRENILKSINTNKLKKIGRTIVDYAPWIIGAAALGTGIGYEVSEYMPAGVSGPYYVEQVAQNYIFMVMGGTLGAVAGTAMKYLENKTKIAKSIAPYAGAAVVGAGIGYLIGEFTGESIAKLAGVKETEVFILNDLKEFIQKGMTILGAPAGIGVYEMIRKNKVPWNKIAKYTASAAGGAGVLMMLGNEFGEDIAELMGVKSQFMGIEKAIAGEMIKYGLAAAGAAIGASGAYLHNRISKKNSL